MTFEIPSLRHNNAEIARKGSFIDMCDC